jgi:hypothetical protein
MESPQTITETAKVKPPNHGIYLFMPESEYHAIDALSKSLIKAYLVCPRDAWEAIHGDHEETDDMVYGSAFHKLIFEGREKFEKLYAKAFDKSQFPDALDTVPEIKKWITDNGGKATGNKGGLIETALSINPDVQIIDVLKVHHSAANGLKKELSPDRYDEILKRASLFEKWDWGKCNSRQTEVSFFWFDKELNCECKARMDLVQFLGGDCVIWDAKTFTNKNRKQIDRAVNDAINYERYYIDASFYTRAVRRTPMIFQDAAKAPDWIIPKNCEFKLLFIEKLKSFPNIVPKDVILSRFGSLTEVGQAADATIRNAASAINNFRQGDQSSPWGTIHKETEFDDTNLNPYIL